MADLSLGGKKYSYCYNLINVINTHIAFTFVQFVAKPDVFICLLFPAVHFP